MELTRTQKLLLVPTAAAGLGLYWYAVYRMVRKVSTQVSNQFSNQVSNQLATTATMPSAGLGLVDEKRPGIVDSLDPEARDKLLAFADAVVRAGLPKLLVTSGRRSPESQAAAMISKVNRGENITKLYKSNTQLILYLLSLPRDAAVWAPVLAQSPVSDHQRGRAVDIRRWNYNDSQLQQLKQMAPSYGWRPLLESDHLHIEL